MPQKITQKSFKNIFNKLMKLTRRLCKFIALHKLIRFPQFLHQHFILLPLEIELVKELRF